MNTIIDKAQIFAQEKHNGQKYGKHPYSVHLLEVYRVAEKFNLNKNIKAACFLHDIIEDTEITYTEIEHKFSYNIAELVYSVTDEIGRNRAERKRKTYRKIVKSGIDSMLLKLCDRIANIEHSLSSKNKKMFEMYFKEHLVFNTYLLSQESDFLVSQPIYIHYISLFSNNR